MITNDEKFDEIVNYHNKHGRLDRRHRKMVARGLRQEWFQSYDFPDTIKGIDIVMCYNQFGLSYKEKTAK